MKIRTDFVTNSSSSSFVIAFNENDIAKKEQAVIVDVVKFLLEASGALDTYRAEKIDDFDEYFEKKYAWRHETLEELLEKDSYSRVYNKAHKCLENGYILYDKSIDYTDELLNSLFEKFSDEFPEIIQVISKD